MISWVYSDYGIYFWKSAPSWHHGAVSSLLKPLTGYVPASQFADRVAGPPTALLSAEQLERAHSDPFSFRFSVGKRAKVSHRQAARWLERCATAGALRGFGPSMLVYRQTDKGASATGLIADVALDAYDTGPLKRHEDTIDKNEQKMANYMRTTRLFGNPVALAHRPNVMVNDLIGTTMQKEPDETFSTVDGVDHELWIVDGAQAEVLQHGFAGPLYVTDGHHRLAAALLVAGESDVSSAYMPAGIFASTELQVAAFLRCVVDPAMDAQHVIDRLANENDLEEVSPFQARPTQRHEYGVRIRDRFFKLRIPAARVPVDMYASLDVNLLQDLILGPVFGIEDARNDKRLRFVADTPVVDSSDLEGDAWFLPTPAAIEDVMRVADSGRVMPPKSTWFGPKLPSGLVIRTID